MLWIVAFQAPLSMGFFRQEYWSELPFPSPGDLSNSRIEPGSLMSPALAGGFSTSSATTMSFLRKLTALSPFSFSFYLRLVKILTTGRHQWTSTWDLQIQPISLMFKQGESNLRFTKLVSNRPSGRIVWEDIIRGWLLMWWSTGILITLKQTKTSTLLA